jgi:hypothetical protein
MRKIISLTFMLTMLLVCQSVILAAEPAIQTTQEMPIWRIDNKNISEMPKSFRMATDPFQNEKIKGELPSRVGLDSLHISGSSEFSFASYDKMIAKIKSVAPGPIYIVDLRQESHGFVNGIAVSAYVSRDWVNVGKSTAQVEKDERAWLRSALKAPVEISVLDDDKNAYETYKIAVDNVLTEKEFVTSRGQNYLRIQATDHSSFTNEQVNDFVKFYKKLPQDAWLHFHCMAGEGRTTQIMVMYDILRNGKQVSFEDIVNRQYLLGGNNATKITVSNEKDAYKVPLYKEKVKLLKKFYEYVTTNPDDLPISWSKWIKEHNQD